MALVALVVPVKWAAPTITDDDCDFPAARDPRSIDRLVRKANTRLAPWETVKYAILDRELVKGRADSA